MLIGSVGLTTEIQIPLWLRASQKCLQKLLV